MSAPFAGPPELQLDTDHKQPTPPAGPNIHEALAALARPRKHYQWYYSTRPANAQMWHCRQGVHNFLRAYFHHKSADWKKNRPHRLASWSAAELAKMPTYYIMDLADDMATTVAKEMPSANEIAACKWLPDRELAVYAAEYHRNGFQGGLNWYRSRTSGAFDNELQLFCDRTIDVPSMFISGKSDWGVYQQPGALELMQSLHQNGRVHSARGRRALDPTGTARTGQFIADRFFCADPPRLKIVSALAVSIISDPRADGPVNLMA